MKTTKLAAALCAAALAATAGLAHAQQQLDRAQLLQLADNYFGALVAHDTSRVPLASNVKIVENITHIQPGEGMWKTASSGPTSFKIVVPDPVSQQVGGIVVM